MTSCNRRHFLKIGTGLLASGLLPSVAWSALTPDDTRRSLAFYNTHTGERLTVCYFKNGGYCPDAMQQINYILRDHRTGEIEAIDPRLIDLMVSVKHQVGCDAPFHIISGYRSPQTNARLRRQGTGVAKRSYHMMGRAIDIRLPGCDTRKLKKACLAERLGGVGYYPKSDFVHVDTGTVRSWSG